MQIEFIPDSHTYMVDGIIVPSVSQIMRPVSEKYYNGISAQVLDHAAKRGTRVHQAIYDMEVNCLPHKVFNVDIQSYLSNWLVIKKLKNIRPENQEIMLTNGKFCGTLDMIAMVDDQLSIIDFKTTAKVNKDLVEIQLAGYKELCEFNGWNIEKCYIIHLRKDGVKLHDITPNTNYWKELRDEALCTM